MPRRLPLLVALAFVALLGLRLWRIYDFLPEIMASHFDAAGRPDGYQRKFGFALTGVALCAGNLALFAALPLLLRRLPIGLINMPHRAYWLAPERREHSIARFCSMLDWFACATIALLVAVFELAVRANLARAPLAAGAIWFLLVSYLAFTAIWSVQLFRAFRLPDTAR
jgi:uncharacterized membrane protein